MLESIKEAAEYIVSKTSIKPVTGIILGSGLGAFVKEVAVETEIPFGSIPHFPVASVEGHKGAIVLGKVKDTPVIILQGRVHFYEGYSMEQITFPVRVMKELGVKNLLLSNAAGGMNPDFSVGDLMVVTDHINLMPNPLIGPHDEKLGPRFPDMNKAYDPDFIERIFRIAGMLDLKLKKGVYVAVTGPTYETEAEYKYFCLIGGDAVGMSTVPEVIVARQAGIRCLAISVITDMGIPGHLQPLSHDLVQREAEAAEPLLARVLKELIRKI
jgi:purine-nucleoside phosphorylase